MKLILIDMMKFQNISLCLVKFQNISPKLPSSLAFSYPIGFQGLLAMNVTTSLASSPQELTANQ